MSSLIDTITSTLVEYDEDIVNCTIFPLNKGENSLSLNNDEFALVFISTESGIVVRYLTPHSSFYTTESFASNDYKNINLDLEKNTLFMSKCGVNLPVTVDIKMPYEEVESMFMLLFTLDMVGDYPDCKSMLNDVLQEICYIPTKDLISIIRDEFKLKNLESKSDIIKPITGVKKSHNVNSIFSI